MTMVQRMGLANFKDKIIFLVLLFLQNIVIYWQHYFNNVGFPWDFSGTPYAWPAFWTTSISMGNFPQCILKLPHIQNHIGTRQLYQANWQRN
jgi:hypothetical protein